MLIVFHGGNAGSFSHGFANRLDIEADVIVQAEEIPVWRIPHRHPKGKALSSTG